MSWPSQDPWYLILSSWGWVFPLESRIIAMFPLMKLELRVKKKSLFVTDKVSEVYWNILENVFFSSFILSVSHKSPFTCSSVWFEVQVNSSQWVKTEALILRWNLESVLSLLLTILWLCFCPSSCLWRYTRSFPLFSLQLYHSGWACFMMDYLTTLLNLWRPHFFPGYWAPLNPAWWRKSTDFQRL